MVAPAAGFQPLYTPDRVYHDHVEMPGGRNAMPATKPIVNGTESWLKIACGKSVLQGKYGGTKGDSPMIHLCLWPGCYERLPEFADLCIAHYLHTDDKQVVQQLLEAKIEELERNRDERSI